MPGDLDGPCLGHPSCPSRQALYGHQARGRDVAEALAEGRGSSVMQVLQADLSPPPNKASVLAPPPAFLPSGSFSLGFGN